MIDVLREALQAADKRLCELSPTPPPDGFSRFEDAERDAKTCGVVMQIRKALAMTDIAQGIEARQGGDGETRLHRNDESPVAKAMRPVTIGHQEVGQ